MKNILSYLFAFNTLTQEEARDVLYGIGSGQYNQSEIAAFLTAYQMRSITVAELAGFQEAMLDLCKSVDLSFYDVMDVCGTGGDGKDTFNISTLAAFVVAGAGQAVAKHGNHGVSSSCGSSTVLEYLGYQFTSDYGQLQYSIERANICFLHAPLFHPAMKKVAPIRR
ncbi:MAG TPA: anthranilate phosphoribosyltransferase, partial [Fibrella sp.]